MRDDIKYRHQGKARSWRRSFESVSRSQKRDRKEASHRRTSVTGRRKQSEAPVERESVNRRYTDERRETEIRGRNFSGSAKRFRSRSRHRTRSRSTRHTRVARGRSRTRPQAQNYRNNPKPRDSRRMIDAPPGGYQENYEPSGG